MPDCLLVAPAVISIIGKVAAPVFAGAALAACTATPPMPQYPATWNPSGGYYLNGGGGSYATPRTYSPPAYSYTPPQPAPDSGWSPISHAYAEPAPAPTSPPPTPLRPVDPPEGDDGTCIGWWRICHFF